MLVASSLLYEVCAMGTRGDKKVRGAGMRRAKRRARGVAGPLREGGLMLASSMLREVCVMDKRDEKE